MHIRLGEVLPDSGQDDPQQGCHLLSFVQKETLVAFGLCKRQRFSEQGRGLQWALLGKVRQSREGQDLHFTASPPMLVRLYPPAFEQGDGLDRKSTRLNSS